MKAFSLLFVLCSTITCMAASPARLLVAAESGTVDATRAEVVQQESFKSGKGVALKSGSPSAVDDVEARPDLTLMVTFEEGGRYVVKTHAAVDALGRAQMARAKSKHESMFLKIGVGDTRPVKRVVFVPWSGPDSCTQELGKFDIKSGIQVVKIWLPIGVRLDSVDFSTYVPPPVPDAAANYRPSIVPPPSHPRLWVNHDSLPKVRANLKTGENAPMWKKVQAAAGKPYISKAKAGEATDHDAELESAAVNKAFVYLMTGDKAKAREAIDLVRGYLAAVEFNNLLDITREIGRAIYAGARVYDWCYDVMTPQEREDIRRNLMRLADDMEIGWPPFKQGVVNGHGAEAQLQCHLLSMAIALYDEDPLPYQYCAYRILEELVPMRNFEYQSPRHNQGIGYGIYRFAWDMHAAWLLYRMSGKKVFNANIEDVHKYWIYMRLPGGESFPEGDGNVDGRKINMGQTSLLTSAYSGNPVQKLDFIEQGGFPADPMLVLLVNDPEVVAATDYNSLPLTLDFGDVLGGMVARTGWNMDENSTDVVVVMTGGGYHFSNHQQADAGSFQLYYHGNQVVDLGQYLFYGTPYDSNFNKRSVAHSMMLAFDPDETFGSRKFLNDGGTRYGYPTPNSPREVQSKSNYRNGKVVSATFGPSQDEPDVSYFSGDLTSAYSKKIKSYVRTFCFLNLHNKRNPAALIVLDNMETSGPEIKKYWQINTLNAPDITPEGVILSSSESGTTGNVHLQMFYPDANKRNLEILSGRESTNVFGTRYTPPKPEAPEANGCRIVFSPKAAATKDTFLTVMSMAEPGALALPVNVSETSDTYQLALAGRMVVLSKTGRFLKEPIEVIVSAPGNSQLLVTGLQPGEWLLRSHDKKVQFPAKVEARKNTATFTVPPERYTLSPN